MNVYQTQKGMYDFTYLPQYAQFILDHHLDEYVHEQIELSYRIDIPLLKHLKHLSKEQLTNQSRGSSIEFLSNLAANNAKKYIGESMERWLTNQLQIIEKLKIEAEDITLINYVRQASLRKWIPLYTEDLNTALSIIAEIDLYILGNNTTATNTYIQILKTHIEEETHFSTNLVSASPAITYIFDLLQQKGIYVSGKVQEVMGYSPDDVLGLGGNVISELGHPDDLPKMVGGLQQMIEENTDRTFAAEFRLRDKWGHYRWLRSYLVVFKREESGKPSEVLGQVYEISKEKSLVKTVEQRELQLLEAQSIARIGSFDWNFSKDTTEYTPELMKIFESKDPQGYENIMANIHPDDKERVVECMAQSMLSGKYECEYRYMINEKEKVLWARSIIVYEDGQPSRMIGTVQDVTERKHIEENLFEKTMELERSNASLQEFASIASHDLKEPLRKIITFSDLLISTEIECLSEGGKTYLQKIMDSASRMKLLIEDILAYSSLSAKEEKENVDLTDIVNDVLSALEMPIKEKGAHVEVSDLPKAMVYPLQMHQLFQNLLSNALKFSKASETLNINVTHTILPAAQVNGYSLQKANEYLQIRIADNGIGFNNESAERIFGLFNRLHSKAQFEGTGLGLAICRKVVDNHGGIIYADSQPGEGSVFTFLLPL